MKTGIGRRPCRPRRIGDGEATTAAAHIVSQISGGNAKFTQKTPSGLILGLSCRAIDGERMITIEDRTEEDVERKALKLPIRWHARRDSTDAGPADQAAPTRRPRAILRAVLDRHQVGTKDGRLNRKMERADEKYG